MIICVDFDGVLHDPKSAGPTHRMGKPYPNAKTVMRLWMDRGHVVIILTARATTTKATMAVVDWLNYFDIPFTRVTNVKPVADLYIDDKAYRHTSWLDTAQYVAKLEPTSEGPRTAPPQADPSSW